MIKYPCPECKHEVTMHDETGCTVKPCECNIKKSQFKIKQKEKEKTPQIKTLEQKQRQVGEGYALTFPIEFEQDSEVIMENSMYKIQDLPIFDDEGNIACTFSKTILHPTKMTRGHMHMENYEVFEVIAGEGIVILQSPTISKVVNLKPGSIIFCGIGIYHKIVNLSKMDLIFRLQAHGKITRPPFTKEDWKL